MSTATAGVNGSGAPVGERGSSPASTARGRCLPGQIGGLLMVGTLVFAGTTQRNKAQCAVDLECRDVDGRKEIFKASGWISQKDGERSVPTPLGEALQQGHLAGLVGSEVAVAVRARVWRESVQWEVEGIYPLTLA